MKYIVRFQSFSLLLIFSLFTDFAGIAQTHTPKYVSMASRTKGYYEYLPEGYSPSGTTTYPLLLFITGIGEFGSGSTTDLPKVLKHGPPKLIQAGTFPKSFTVNGQTHRFIVITPQFVTSPRPTADDIEPILNYILANYKVNPRRIYISGLSYGGGIAWAYPGDNAAYAQRIAATAPIAGATPTGGDTTIYARSRVIADNNVPVWAFHNSDDPSTSVGTTHTYINSINQTPAPTPLAKKTIFTSSGHDAWTKAYSPTYKENNLNVYEWMLQYQRGTTTAKTIQVNIYGSTSTTSPYVNTAWNNWNIGTVAATNISSTTFKYSNGTSSTVSATLSDTRSIADNGSAYGGVMAPPEVLRSTSSSSSLRTLTLKGLSTTKKYNLEFYASSVSSTAGSTVFTVSGRSVTINSVKNLLNKATFTGITPNSSGQIVVSINKTASYSYLNGFAITENLTPSSSPRYVKTNIFGGSNSFSNAEWNDWNMGTVEASNISSAAFKYSDGVTSAISATLSHTRPMVDNGSTYGGGMAPAPVLRYTSSSTLTRTLTLKGLSTTKMYNLELYASRGSTTAGSTTFSINGTVKSINAVNNLTNKATFTNITPNSSGQIVVSIGKTSTYSYINGFILTETSSSVMSTEKNTDLVERAPITTEASVASVELYPNPVAGDVFLKLKQNYTGIVQVQVSDAAGKVQKRFQFTQSGGIMQQRLSLQGLPKGTYFVTVITGKTQQTVPVVKE